MNKIPILGIDNAGKTSLILTFQRQFQAISEIVPTKGIERTQFQFLDKLLTVWDFGGQIKYRNRHLDNAEANFSDISIWFFVVDIQDQARFPDVLEYFQLVRNAILKNSPDSYLNLLIHKYDPEITSDPDLLPLIEVMEKKLLALAQPLNAKIYRTSIFHPMSVIHAFSKTILGDTILSEDISHILNNFLITNQLKENVMYFLIYSQDFVELGGYMHPSMDPRICRDNAYHFFTVFDSNDFTLNSAKIYLESAGLDLFIHKNQLEKHAYYFIAAYYKEKIPNMPIFQNGIAKLQENIQKLLLFY